MKLLISAYASAPHHGSEHAVGWNWITEAHRLGHEVWALASPAHRQAIEAACRADLALAGIKWFFPEVRFWPLAEGRDAVWERSHNLLWQMAALRLSRRLAQGVSFDAVHHLTWAGIRAPTFLGSLGVPLIIGPIGGGETSPPSLRRDLRLKARLTELIRDISNATITLNPTVRGGLRKAAVIFVKTPETRALLPRRWQDKTEQFAELTIRREQIGAPRGDRAVQPRLLFVGRLLYWKGAHLALQAFAQLRSHMPSARMTIIGRGPEEARLKAQAAALGIAEDVAFIGWLPREQISEIYDTHDLMVFPSLHDSGGTVVLEALGRGLPVMCLDLGGPRQIVTAASGVTIETGGRNAAEVARAMAAEMARLFAAPAVLRSLSAGAVARAMEFLVSTQVGKFYRTSSQLIGAKEENTVFSEEGGSPPGKSQKTFVSPPVPTSPAMAGIGTLAQN